MRMTTAQTGRSDDQAGDASGTITSGGAAQTALAAAIGRRWLLIQNLDAAEDLWFNLGSAAVVGNPSMLLKAGASYENPSHYCPTDLVSVIAATTGHKFALKTKID